MNLKAYRRISDLFLTTGVLGFLASRWLPFLPDTFATPLTWGSILLIGMAIALRLVEVVDHVRARFKWEAAFRARHPYQKKAVRKEPRQFPTALYLISLSVAALGLALIFLFPGGYQSHLMQSAAVDWPHTVGEVISADVIKQNRRNFDEEDYYQPKIVTQYVVNGRIYTTREIHFNQSSSWRSDSSYAYELVNKFSPGSQVDVYYDPDNPYVAVLDRSTDWFTYFLMTLGALFVLCGVYWFWLSLRDTYRFFKGLFRKQEMK